MRRPEFIARHGRCPSGFLGGLLARLMAYETAPENETALRLLDVQPSDHVLEIGFGHGRTIAMTSARARDGFVAGVDPSESMLRMARRRNRQRIAEGKVELVQGDATRLPYPDSRFDKVYSVHTLYFWADPAVTLREIRRVMKPGARFVLGFRPFDDQRLLDEFPAPIYKFYPRDEVQAFFRMVGFSAIQLLTGPSRTGKVLFAVAGRGA